tara:strand:+ start:1094 stop:1936 length:843 start_codon:yes stop_codon:yes gene_type:complete
MPTQKIIYQDAYSDVDIAAMNYMKEVTFGFESDGSASEIIRKWMHNVQIKMHAVNNDGTTTTPNADDYACLKSLVAELNSMIETIDITLLTAGESDECVSETHGPYTSGSCFKTGTPKPTINFYVTTKSRWETISNLDATGLGGQFQTYWSASNNILYRALCWVKDSLTADQRKSLIREELTQALGMGKDSASYSTSIFYEDTGEPGWNTSYSELDKKIIKMLYDPRTKCGMTKAEAAEALKKPSAFISGRSYEFSGIKANESDNAKTKLATRFSSSNQR